MSNLLKRKNVLNVEKYLRKMDQNIDLIVLDKTARTAKDAAKSLNKENEDSWATKIKDLFRFFQKEEYFTKDNIKDFLLISLRLINGR